jgi:hypothetical protein
MHTTYYKYCPESFRNTWKTVSENNPDLNLRNSRDLQVPFPRIDLFKKLPIYTLPTLWNDIGDLRFQTNATTFKIALRDHLFEKLNEENNNNYS